jgi:hypothetical protein
LTGYFLSQFFALSRAYTVLFLKERREKDPPTVEGFVHFNACRQPMPVYTVTTPESRRDGFG